MSYSKIYHQEPRTGHGRACLLVSQAVNLFPVWSGTERIFPASKGFFMLDHPEQYNLPQGISRGPYKQVYGASMFHQIHCLVCYLSSPSTARNYAQNQPR
jgi:hypothetical protein